MKSLRLYAVAGLLAAWCPAQSKLVPAYPERDILSPFRHPQEIYAPPDAVFATLRIMRGLANDASLERHFDKGGIEIVDDPRWQHAREELDRLGINAGYLAQVMRTSRNDDDRDVAFYGMFFCLDAADVFNLIGHIPGEPQPKTREQAYPRAIAWLQAHLQRRWGDLTDADKTALNLPAIGSPAANAAGLKRPPRDTDYLYAVNLKPFIQLLALDNAVDQAQGLWFLKECSLIRSDLAAGWLEPALPRLRELLHSDDARVREQARGLYAAIGGAKLPKPPDGDGAELDAWVDRAERHLFPPIRAVSEALVLLLPSPDRDAIAAAGRQALLGDSIGEAVNSQTRTGKTVRGFRIPHVPAELKALQLPDGAVITALNGEPVDDGKKLLAQVERALQPHRDRAGRVLNAQRSLLVEFVHDGDTRAIEYRVR